MRRFALFFFSAFLFSCVPAPRPSVVSPEVSGNQLLEVVADNAAFFTSLKGVAWIDIREAGRKTVRGKHVLLVKKPSRLRAEILGLFGQPVAVVVVDGKSAAILALRDGILYEGKPSSRNVERVLLLPFEIEDLVNILLYQVPLLDYRETALKAVPEGGFTLVLKKGENLREELSFDADKKLVGARFIKDGQKILAVGYEAFRENPKPFPRRLHIDLPGRKLAAEVEFLSLEVNVDLGDELFRLAKPDGFQVRPFP